MTSNLDFVGEPLELSIAAIDALDPQLLPPATRDLVMRDYAWKIAIQRKRRIDQVELLRFLPTDLAEMFRRDGCRPTGQPDETRNVVASSTFPRFHSKLVRRILWITPAVLAASTAVCLVARAWVAAAVLGTGFALSVAAAVILVWISIPLARRTWMVGVSWFGTSSSLRLAAELADKDKKLSLVVGDSSAVFHVVAGLLIVAGLWFDYLDRRRDST